MNYLLENLLLKHLYFLLLDFETSWCLYELAKIPEIQDRVHEENNEVLTTHNGEFTYDAMNEMKYLEMYHVCIDGNFCKNFFFSFLFCWNNQCNLYF